MGMSKTRKDLEELLRRGVLDIVGAGVINKFLVLFTTIVLVRLLNKNEYGVFTYAFNIIDLVMVFSSLGINSALLQFASEEKDKDKRGPIYRVAVYAGIISNLVFSVGVFIYSTFSEEKIVGTNSVLRMFSAIFIFQFLFSCVVNYYRTELDNRRYRTTTNVNSVFYFMGASIGAWLFAIPGTVMGRYLGFAVAILYGCYFIKGDLKKIFAKNGKKYDGTKRLLKYGVIISITNAVSQILYTVDVLVVGIVVGTSVSVADYKTATIIPFGLAFIPQMIVTFIYPYFARNREDKVWIKKQLERILLYLAIVNMLITIAGIVFAPVIIRIAFGVEYMGSINCFRILMVSYFFSGTFRVLFGNILAMLRKVEINLYFGIAESLINIPLDFVFIKLWGSVGAAIATTGIAILSAVMSGSYLFWYLHREIRASLDKKEAD